MAAPLEEFTRAVLAHEGAIVEPDERGLAAVLPAPLAAQLQLGEYQRLVFDPQLEADGGLRIDYDSPLLERLGAVVDRFGRVGWLSARHVPLRDIDAADEIERALVVTNGVVRNCRAEPARALYVGFFVEYALVADDQVSGLADVWINATFGALPRADGRLVHLVDTPHAPIATASPCDIPEGLAATVRQAWPLAAAAAEASAKERLREAIDSLNRRRDRDFARLRDYYASIDQEIRRRARRAIARTDADAVRAETSRLEATAQAYRSRVTDLVDRYRVRIRVKPLGALACELPVHAVTVRLHRRSASRDVRLAWNALAREIDRPLCEGCGQALQAVTLCDERVHLLCDRCFPECGECGRRFCRACHAACPRGHER